MNGAKGDDCVAVPAMASTLSSVWSVLPFSVSCTLAPLLSENERIVAPDLPMIRPIAAAGMVTLPVMTRLS